MHPRHPGVPCLVGVWVVLLGQLVVCLLDVLIAGSLSYAEDLVEILARGLRCCRRKCRGRQGPR